jgi:hypothetical protein
MILSFGDFLLTFVFRYKGLYGFFNHSKNLSETAAKTALNHVIGCLSYTMKHWMLNEVIHAENHIITTHPGSIAIFADSLAENLASPSTIANICDSIEKWTDYVFAEFGIASKYLPFLP